MANKLGQYLKAARNKKRYSLLFVSKKLKLGSPQSVWDWENDKGAGIPAKHLIPICKMYGVSFKKTSDLYIKDSTGKAKRKAEKAMNGLAQRLEVQEKRKERSQGQKS